MIEYQALTRWQASEIIDVEVVYGTFDTKQAALDYAAHAHESLMFMDKKLILFLNNGDCFTVAKKEFNVYQVKPKFRDVVVTWDDYYQHIDIAPENLESLGRIWRTFCELSYGHIETVKVTQRKFHWRRK